MCFWPYYQGSATMQSTSPRVLAIHAHPDDIEIQCAGTLLRLKQLGCPISLATMTPGDCGSAELPPDEIAAVRRAEAQRSADIIGADYTCLEFRDLSIVVDNDRFYGLITRMDVLNHLRNRAP